MAVECSMNDIYTNLVEKVFKKEKLTLPEWQLLAAKGFAQREKDGDNPVELLFTTNGRIDAGYELTDEGKKLRATEA
ncbi:MAG TPA: hypothetical protein VEC36_00380 [Patescibacteria group bacterium]|nr:hypothetical protein [Patescibacteria group bacterium]